MDFISDWWDVIFFLILLVIHLIGWKEIKKALDNDPQNDLENRQFAASILNSASVAGITAVSILIPASVLIMQCALSANISLPPGIIPNVLRASFWFLASLCLGLFLVALIPMRAQKFNVVRKKSTGGLLGPQLLSLFIGMIWLILCMWKIANA